MNGCDKMSEMRIETVSFYDGLFCAVTCSCG
jgi:hypothetical protein